MNDLPEYLVLGKIVRARGLKGEVKAEIYLRDPSRLPAFKEVYLERAGSWIRFSILKNVVRENFWYLTFEGVDTRDKSESLGKARIAVPSPELADLSASEDQYYQFQLFGLQVKDASGRTLGIVKQITPHKAVDYLLVEGDSFLTIPMSKSIIAKIDPGAGEILLKMDWPE